jgi:hypothetical protein
MKRLKAKDRQMSGGAPKLAVVSQAIEDQLSCVIVHISKPGDYRIAVPTSDQASELKKARPEGLLLTAGPSLVWVEPITPNRA